MKRVVAAGLGIAVACTPIAPPSGPIAPPNSCPAHPCAAYDEDAGIACNAGACVASAPAPANHLVILVAMPIDAHSAPGLTFAISFPDATADSGATFLPWSLNLGRYLLLPQNILDVNGDTGNSGRPGGVITALPVHATYRPLWPPGSASSAAQPDGGQPLADAVTAGLALYPIEVDAVPARNGPGFLGPSGGPDVAFEAYVQAGMTYERTLAPDPPFDQTFPPDINRVEFPPGEVSEAFMYEEYGPDITKKTELTATVPTFDLSRADGQSLDGWTAYLRDATTKRAISPIKSLSGTTTSDGGLLLPTSHHPQPVGDNPPDALTNAELVMAPAAGQSMPAAVFPAVAVLPRAETYAFVPQPVTVQGSIAWSDRHPVLADVVFEATGIYAVPPMPASDPSDAGTLGLGDDAGDAGRRFPLQTQGFEYVAHASAQPDPEGVTSTYSIILPRGEYRIYVRPLDVAPLDGGASPSHSVQVFERFNTGQADDPIVGPDITIDLAPILTGAALVADQRPLAGATVEALPIHCARPMRNDSGTPPPDSPACMPRYAQTTTAESDGSFALALDPGDYVVRAEPADGTRLPWVAQVVSVPTSSPVTFRIPAPVHRELQVFAQDGIAVANAIVRIFTLPASGPAIELGRALTDATGRFDVYVDPASQ